MAGNTTPGTLPGPEPVPAPVSTLDKRQGLNASFAYDVPGTNANVTYWVRAVAFGYGTIQLSSETMNRIKRAFYPRNVINSPFYVTIAVKGVAERASFSNFIKTYSDSYLSPDSQYPPVMVFTLGSLKVQEYVIPTSGFQWGNSVGAMMWTPTITMQIADSTYLPSGVQRTGGVGISDLDMNNYTNSVLKASPEVQYFYPEGIQLTGDQAPPSGNWDPALGPLSAVGVDSTAQGTPTEPGNPSSPVSVPGGTLEP